MEKLNIQISGEEIRHSKLNVYDLIDIKANSKLSVLYDLELVEIVFKDMNKTYKFEDIILELGYEVVLRVDKMEELKEVSLRLEVGL